MYIRFQFLKGASATYPDITVQSLSRVFIVSTVTKLTEVQIRPSSCDRMHKTDCYEFGHTARQTFCDFSFYFAHQHEQTKEKIKQHLQEVGLVEYFGYVFCKPSLLLRIQFSKRLEWFVILHFTDQESRLVTNERPDIFRVFI